MPEDCADDESFMNIDNQTCYSLYPLGECGSDSGYPTSIAEWNGVIDACPRFCYGPRANLNVTNCSDTNDPMAAPAFTYCLDDVDDPDWADNWGDGCEWYYANIPDCDSGWSNSDSWGATVGCSGHCKFARWKRGLACINVFYDIPDDCVDDESIILDDLNQTCRNFTNPMEDCVTGLYEFYGTGIVGACPRFCFRPRLEILNMTCSDTLDPMAAPGNTYCPDDVDDLSWTDSYGDGCDWYYANRPDCDSKWDELEGWGATEGCPRHCIMARWLRGLPCVPVAYSGYG
jgi:hypothetical protein